MISVVTWKWRRPDGSSLFSAVHVNRLRAALERHLRLPHKLFCVTDDAAGLDERILAVPLPTDGAHPFRCRRRMWQFAKERASVFGPRMLCMDLDVVIVDDITSLVDRPERMVFWKVGYAKVYSGSFHLTDTGALDGAWTAYRDDPEGYPRRTGLENASDQAMLNMYLRGQTVPHWTERDGIVTFFGAGYERLSHHGVGPKSIRLPRGTRIVVFGSDDMPVMESGRLPWVREHWLEAA